MQAVEVSSVGSAATTDDPLLSKNSMALPDTCAGLLSRMQLGDIPRSALPAPPVASSSSSGTAAILTAPLFAGADVSLPARQLNPLPPSPPAQLAAINHSIAEPGRPLRPQPGPEYFAELHRQVQEASKHLPPVAPDTLASPSPDSMVIDNAPRTMFAQHNTDDDDNYTAEAEEWDSDEDEPDDDHEDEQTNLPPPTHHTVEEAEEDPEPDFEQGANRFLVPAHARGAVIELNSTPSPPPSPPPLHLSPRDVFRDYIHYPSIDLVYVHALFEGHTIEQCFGVPHHAPPPRADPLPPLLILHIKQEEIISLHRVLIRDIPGIESTLERYVTNCNRTIRRTEELMELASIHNRNLLHINARLIGSVQDSTTPWLPPPMPLLHPALAPHQPQTPVILRPTVALSPAMYYACISSLSFVVLVPVQLPLSCGHCPTSTASLSAAVFGPPIHDVTSLKSLNLSLQTWYDMVASGSPKTKEALSQSPAWVDVCDTALAHVRALKHEAAGAERILTVSAVCCWQKWINTANNLKPNLLPSHKFTLGYPEISREKVILATLDKSKEERIFGIKFKTMEETARDTLEDFVRCGW
ncbi:unnamed protein product [Cyclocybe aegerita]|uniref:Uncharacterized protein n=1 Tax=Cyclocybe aegerita TaxID=1973307 RepID=A0A8S0WSB6_CYCAE|nr:unnamed protein product [Cyclocybe aegerita]